MTPQMQQSIKLLQLSTIELNTYLHQALLENPFMELESSEEQLPETALEDQEDSFSSEWANLKTSQYRPTDGNLSLEERLPQTLTLQHYLREQLHHHTTNTHLRDMGAYLIDLIEDDGYLRVDLDNIAVQTGYCPKSLNDVLGVIQGFDPVGVGARNLEECLKLQLEDQKLLTADLVRILDQLPKLIEWGPQKLAKFLNMEQSDLRKYLDLFRSLNPKPGLVFANQHPVVHVIPDVLLRRTRMGEWICELNESALPRLFIDRDSYLAVSSKEGSQQDRQYINTHISNANWLIKTLRQRSLTILAVTQAIVIHQTPFLNLGRAYLKPLNLMDIAKELGIHESTISRSITGKYVSTPFGTIELKAFFSGSASQKGRTSTQADVANVDSRGVSTKVVQLKIKELIDQERKQDPLSDDQLCQSLRNEGVEVARRTVTKYRESLNIPSSYERKKISRLLTF